MVFHYPSTKFVAPSKYRVVSKRKACVYHTSRHTGSILSQSAGVSLCTSSSPQKKYLRRSNPRGGGL